MRYSGRDAARAWFRESLSGVCNVTLPTFTPDLRRLDEAAIEHDVRHSIELGFEGTLIVSEAGTTPEEYERFVEVGVNAAAGELVIVVQASFDTLDDARTAVSRGEQHGADAFLVGVPPTFRPKSTADFVEYHRDLCAASELACVLFAAAPFDFGNLHPTGFPIEAIDDLLAIPNVAALKYEPIGPMGPALLEVQRKVAGEIPVVCPFDSEAPAFAALLGQRWLGTSVYQYAADRIPEMWRLLQEDRYEDAMAIYWQIAPARSAKAADKRRWEGSNMLHRYMWKYYSWLVGYNGGPLRSPVMRLSRQQMLTARRALEASGITSTHSADEEFFAGRTRSGAR